ncbi:MAG TPA: hypothetical protein VK837_00305 [Longimicrobiales bacterium]|nr:hypothetical protein [Longimicrobiales bacterium]
MHRTAASLFAALALTLVVQFLWSLFSAVPLPSGEGGFLAESVRDAAVVLSGLGSVAGIVAGLYLALTLARRGSQDYADDVILFLTSSALGVATQLLPAAAYRLLGRFDLLWSRIPFVGDHITSLAFLVAGVSYVRFTARFPVPLLEHRLSRIGRITAVHSLTPFAWLWLGLVPILMLDRTEATFEGLLGFGWSFLVWLIALLILMSAGLYNLVLANRIGSNQQARRARIVLASLVAFGLSLALAILVAMLGDPSGVADTVFGAGYLVHLLLLLFAVLLFGALEPSLAIRKSARITLLAVLGVFFFSGVESVLSDLVIGTLGLPSILSSFLAGGLVAAMLTLWHLRAAPAN